MRLPLDSVRVSHRRAESDDVAVGIDENTLVLSPVSVLGWSHVRSSNAPFLSKFIRVVNPKIGSTSDGPRVVFGHKSEVDLDSVTGRKSVPSAPVLPGCEAKPLVVGK